MTEAGTMWRRDLGWGARLSQSHPRIAGLFPQSCDSKRSVEEPAWHFVCTGELR